jgi:histone-lysine N-methyltransferase SUV39H
MVTAPDENFMVGCSCEGGNCADEEACTCVGNDDTEGRHVSYTLDGKIIDFSRKVIYECNSKCGCGEECTNRVVQCGRQILLEIYKTPNRGWGVRALQRIEEGSFFTEYVGKIISIVEAEMLLESAGAKTTPKTSYLFDLDLLGADHATYTVDAFGQSNVTRFVNHSCEPNLTAFNIFVESQDMQLYRIAFFANKDIEVGEELTFDYQPSFDNGLGDAGLSGSSDASGPKRKRARKKKGKKQAVMSPGRKQQKPIKCFCGAENCRGVIYNYEDD